MTTSSNNIRAEIAEYLQSTNFDSQKASLEDADQILTLLTKHIRESLPEPIEKLDNETTANTWLRTGWNNYSWHLDQILTNMERNV